MIAPVLEKSQELVEVQSKGWIKALFLPIIEEIQRSSAGRLLGRRLGQNLI
jgi:hypothetical protein